VIQAGDFVSYFPSAWFHNSVNLENVSWTALLFDITEQHLVVIGPVLVRLLEQDL